MNENKIICDGYGAWHGNRLHLPSITTSENRVTANVLWDGLRWGTREDEQLFRDCLKAMGMQEALNSFMREWRPEFTKSTFFLAAITSGDCSRIPAASAAPLTALIKAFYEDAVDWMCSVKNKTRKPPYL